MCLNHPSDDVQAQGEAQATAHVPKPPVAEDAEASSVTPVLENYLSIDGKELVLLEKSIELRSADLPQSRRDDAHRNLIPAFAACG